jgi:predicted dehydrogenase
MTDQPVRFGIVGAGFAAQRMNLPALAEIPGALAVAIADTNEARAREVAAASDVPRAYGSYEAMLKDGELEAVIVNTPNALHAPVAEAALAAGCHVVVEKPMARNADEAARLAALAQQRGLLLGVDLHLRYTPLFQAAHALTGSGQLGDIYHVRAMLWRRNGIPGYGSWFTTAALSGGGALLDIGSHMLDLALWLSGEPTVRSVSAVTSDRLGRAGVGRGGWGIDRNTGTNFDVDDSVSAFIRCANGAVINLDVAWAAHSADNDGQIHLLGSEAGLLASYGRGPAKLELYTERDGEPVTLPQEIPVGEPSHRALLRGFVAAVRGEGPVPVPAADGVRLARLSDAIYASARAGREIELGD